MYTRKSVFSSSVFQGVLRHANLPSLILMRGRFCRINCTLQRLNKDIVVGASVETRLTASYETWDGRKSCTLSTLTDAVSLAVSPPSQTVDVLLDARLPRHALVSPKHKLLFYANDRDFNIESPPSAHLSARRGTLCNRL